MTNKPFIYTFWTGVNELTPNRLECLKNLREVSECDVILVTPENLDNYILDDHPLHEAYQYLSETHKADYLRTYFMNFHGGGYSDIKKTTGSWLDSFQKLEESDRWIIGYQEIEGGAAIYPHLWRDMIGNGAYICKAKTLLTEEWYDEMISLLETKLERLKINPSRCPDDRAENGSGYPIEWNEMLGRIFHRLCYKHKEKILNTLPISKFTDYR